MVGRSVAEAIRTYPAHRFHISRVHLTAVALLLLAAASISDAFAADLAFLTGEFWVEIDPLIEIDEDLEDPEDQIRILLEEARYVFSGMLYGFDFRYVPLDLTREVEEEFELTPLREIGWADPRLQVAESWYRNGRRYAYIRYWISEEQDSWVRYWESSRHKNAAAFGEESFFDGRTAKYGAIERGMLEAIRAFLRPRELNKPKEVAGRLALSAAPYIIIDSGLYRAKVELKLDIREIVPYKVF